MEIMIANRRIGPVRGCAFTNINIIVDRIPIINPVKKLDWWFIIPVYRTQVHPEIVPVQALFCIKSFWVQNSDIYFEAVYVANWTWVINFRCCQVTVYPCVHNNWRIEIMPFSKGFLPY